jgi:uncharacterized protein (TIGR03437 family)
MQCITRVCTTTHSCKTLLGLFLLSFLPLAAQQFPLCVANAGNNSLRSEGLTESATDLTLSCSGATPNTPATAIVSIFTPTVNITNHLSTGNTPDVVVSVMANGVQQPTPASVQLVGTNQLNISGIQYTPGADGGVTIKISNLRVNANAAAKSNSPLIPANIIATGLILQNTQVFLGAVTSGLLSSDTSAGIFCAGSPIPSTINLPNLLSTGTRYSTTRVTEGFANAFTPKDATSDTGTRLIIKYAGLPASTRLFVPDVIAGSSALQATSAGDFGLPAAPGTYASSATGSLLLSRVYNAAADGTGGSPFYRIPAGGTPAITLSNASELQLSSGAGYVVYEVIDANPSVRESAQIPTFVTLTSPTDPGTYGSMNVTFAPLSTVAIATMTDPVPRFAAVQPPVDCTALGDCNANYYPHLKMNTSSVPLSTSANGDTAVGYIPFQNSGGGTLNWTANVAYQTGSGWLTLGANSGSGSSTVTVRANPAGLAPGTYNATVTIDAGPMAGSQAVPVTLQVGAAVPLVTWVASAADGNVVTVVPDSFASIYGTGLAGSNVNVTFDGAQAKLVYQTDKQINLLVPASVAGKTSSQVMVSVDGRSGMPKMVNVANAAPAIFTNGVLNQDNTVNAVGKSAARASVLQIFLTGLPPVSGATVTIGNRTLQSVYSGQAPGIPGLEQVNVLLPADLTGTAQLSVCSGQVCSPAYSVSIQ